MHAFASWVSNLQHDGGARRTETFWRNAYAISLIATVVLVQGVFITRTVPRLAQAFYAANQALPLSVRLMIGASGAFPWVAVGAILVVMAARRSRVKIPAMIGEVALPVAAWLVVAGTVIALTLAVAQIRPIH